jgi:hypothetical protein
VGSKVFLYNPTNQENRYLEFDKQAMGKPLLLEWVAQDRLLICYATGRVSVIDLNPASFGTEIVGLKPFMSEAVTHLQVNFGLNKVAVCNISSIKFLNMTNW